jgi:ComF family protein
MLKNRSGLLFTTLSTPLFAALFGGGCFLCRGAARGLLCEDCGAELPRLEGPRCPRCALASPGGAVCGRCLAHPPRYDASVAALAYEFPADVLVHSLKFRGELALAPFLGALLGDAVRAEPRVDCIVPVPLSRRRLAERGYNQAAELARALAARAGAPLELFACERSRDTPQQADLPWSERAKNVRGAFRGARSLAGKSVAVVDDVMTTGATLDEVAGALKEAGAVRVVNWVVARTLPPGAD